MIPKLLTRYVVWELTKIFLVSSAGFVGLMVIISLTEEALDHGLGPDIVFQLTPYVLPKALMFAMPATCLFSACVVFGRLSADNELVALQSMGLPKSVMVMPALAMAFLSSLVAVWLNDISFAWSYWGIEKVVLESSDRIAYGVLRTEGSFRSDRFSIEVDGVEDRRLINPVITVKDPKKGDIRAVAHEAFLSTDPERHLLSFTLTKGMIDVPGKLQMKFDDSLPLEVPLKSPDEIARSTGNPSHLYLSQIRQAIARQKIRLRDLKTENAIRCAGQWLTGDIVSLVNADWKERIESESLAERRLTRLHVVPHRRWANGFSCLAFVMIGIPIAIRLKTSNYATTFGACFLPILFVYYPLFMFGLNGAKLGTLPAWGTWLGDATCFAVGACLLAREFRR